jgi:ferritin-like metal-binding protein YciE
MPTKEKEWRVFDTAYFVSARGGLIEMARALAEEDALELLRENLKEEKQAVPEVESVAKVLRDGLKKVAVS